jgi:hypothetical protein
VRVGAVCVPVEMKNDHKASNTRVFVGTGHGCGWLGACACDAYMRAGPQLGRAQCTQFVCAHPTACPGSPTFTHSHTHAPLAARLTPSFILYDPVARALFVVAAAAAAAAASTTGAHGGPRYRSPAGNVYVNETNYNHWDATYTVGDA